MTKQELAKYRNCNKFMLSRIHKPIKFEYLTEEEQLLVKQMYDIHKQLMNNWNDNSVKLGLLVKPKCWCGKIGKYTAEYETFHKDKLVCKKHIKNE